MQNTVFYTCRRPFGSGGQSRSSAPASSRRRGGADGRVPLVRGEGGEWHARVRSGGSPMPVGRCRRPRIPFDRVAVGGFNTTTTSKYKESDHDGVQIVLRGVTKALD